MVTIKHEAFGKDNIIFSAPGVTITRKDWENIVVGI